MLQNYLNYLEALNARLHRYFKQQEPYICCQRGCAKCCQNGEYPFSEIEFQLLMFGFVRLPENLKREVLVNVEAVKAGKLETKNDVYTYKCPFLINNECSVYPYRGIICRSFGLISAKEGQKPKIPFCAKEGLNYSRVLNRESDVISSELYKALNIDTEPLAYNVGYETLTNKGIEDEYGFKFGDKKALIDWFDDERNIIK